MTNILICDDERDIVKALQIYLSTQSDLQIFTAYDGKEALDVIRKSQIQLVLLDIMMPGMDGIETLAKLREFSNIPVILLTAKSESADKILGLNIGADDYITKPFDPMEVIARIRSQLRRYTTLGSQITDESVYKNNGLILNDTDKTVALDGQYLELTPTEFGILKLLISHPGQVFNTSQIYESVWNEDALGNEKSVAVHIRHLREKIEIDPSNPRYIQVVWGVGYKMNKGGH